MMYMMFVFEPQLPGNFVENWAIFEKRPSLLIVQDKLQQTNAANGETKSECRRSMAGGVGVSRQISRTDALSVVGMAKSSVSSSAETAILNQQKMLRETLSSSSGTAVWIDNQDLHPFVIFKKR